MGFQLAGRAFCTSESGDVYFVEQSTRFIEDLSQYSLPLHHSNCFFNSLVYSALQWVVKDTLDLEIFVQN